MGFLSKNKRRAGFLHLMVFILAFLSLGSGGEQGRGMLLIPGKEGTGHDRPETPGGNVSYDEALESGAYFESLGQLEPALNEYYRASNIRPGEPFPHLSMGNIYLKAKRYIEAEQSYLKAIELAPRKGIYYNGLAWLYIEMELPLKALDYARRAYNTDTGKSYIYLDTMAVAESDMGNYILALNHFRDAATEVPVADLDAQLIIYTHLYEMFIRMGDEESSNATYDKMEGIKMGVTPIFDF